MESTERHKEGRKRAVIFYHVIITNILVVIFYSLPSPSVYIHKYTNINAFTLHIVYPFFFKNWEHIVLWHLLLLCHIVFIAYDNHYLEDVPFHLVLGDVFITSWYIHTNTQPHSKYWETVKYYLISNNIVLLVLAVTVTHSVIILLCLWMNTW